MTWRDWGFDKQDECETARVGPALAGNNVFASPHTEVTEMEV